MHTLVCNNYAVQEAKAARWLSECKLLAILISEHVYYNGRHENEEDMDRRWEPQSDPALPAPIPRSDLPPPTWMPTADGWSAHLGDAQLHVERWCGRYRLVMDMDDTRFTESGFGYGVWAMWRAEEIARTGERGGGVSMSCDDVDDAADFDAADWFAMVDTAVDWLLAHPGKGLVHAQVALADTPAAEAFFAALRASPQQEELRTWAWAVYRALQIRRGAPRTRRP